MISESVLAIKAMSTLTMDFFSLHIGHQFLKNCQFLDRLQSLSVSWTLYCHQFFTFKMNKVAKVTKKLTGKRPFPKLTGEEQLQVEIGKFLVLIFLFTIAKGWSLYARNWTTVMLNFQLIRNVILRFAKKCERLMENHIILNTVFNHSIKFWLILTEIHILQDSVACWNLGLLLSK